jgi:hypothetical protein
MAGGASWIIVRKADKLESWKKEIEDGEGTVVSVELWERKTVEIEIRKQVAAPNINIGIGDLGRKSGSVTGTTGAGRFRTTHTRSVASPGFVCTGDETAIEQPFADWYNRTQVWESVGEDELVGTETPPETPGE